jgi:hypothetical protein
LTISATYRPSTTAMSVLGYARRLQAWVLASFLLALGVATAAPLFQTLRVDQVCSVSGTLKSIVQDQGSDDDTGMSGMQCALCLPTGLPPSPHVVGLSECQVGTCTLLPAIHSLVVTATAAPPPGRGPPFV